MNSLRKHLSTGAGVALVGLAIVWLGSSWLGGRRAEPMPRGEPAPPFEVALRGGEVFDLEAHRGQIVVLNFWASWCPPCRAEAPVIERAHARLSRGEGVLLGIAMDARSLPAARGLGMTYPQALATQQLADAYAVRALPTTVVIDREGHVAWSHTGEVTDADMNRALDAAGSR